MVGMALRDLALGRVAIMLPTLCKLNQASPTAEILGVLKEKGTESACPNRSEEIAQDEREKPNTGRFRSGRDKSTQISQG